MEPFEESAHLIRKEKEGKGLSMMSAVAYIVSIFGIPPLITLPGALEYCGIYGFLIIPILILIQAYTATLLGMSWLIVEKNWPKETGSHAKYPYSALAMKVGGQNFRRVVATIQMLAIFGESVPFLLLGSENLHHITNLFLAPLKNLSFCYILILTALIITPILWLGTAKDLRFFTWISGSSILVLWILVICLLTQNAPVVTPSRIFLPSSWLPFAYCFGVVAFQFGVHPIILTIQMDMKDKTQLPTACIIAFTAVFIFYGTIAALAYFLYGESIQANLLENFSDGPILYVTQIIVSIQALLCLALGINALYQTLEDSLGIPETFGWRRILLRTTVMLLVLFVAETIPHFAIALDLVGGLLMTPIVFIFPPIFYNVLKYKVNGYVIKGEAFLGGLIVLIGIIGCIASSTESGIQISRLKAFVPPCYVSSVEDTKTLNATTLS
ncbi:UNVERIFIED_CONTAM: hypothetical protein RMT77_018860 [Armadillidium vulgare]